MELDDLRAINLANWNDRVPVHVGSTSDYDVDRYVSDPERLSEVVQLDRGRLGDLTGKRVVHLQCHIGTDTLTVARLGAAEVTGVDFSAPAIEAARDLFARCGTPGRFVESELYDAPTALNGETFDIVYTGVGAINWLPDIAGWAKVVAALLEPGGRLVLRDGHPALFVIDHTRSDDLLVPLMAYLSSDPQIFNEEGTYADPDANIENNTTVEWVHSISSIINGLLAAGMRIDRFDEFDTIDWKALDHMVPAGPNLWALPPHQSGHVPLGFAIEATKT